MLEQKIWLRELLAAVTLVLVGYAQQNDSSRQSYPLSIQDIRLIGDANRTEGRIMTVATQKMLQLHA
ncbi:hypothetical protein DPMN_191779 [Dreissena polymorpha]|uniref:Uncharacterized protein n=1 Tax=Dreissena polymorpha TaxID=45954 RepID=A0A9D3XZT7_DREPO|nr:hypothetical protein DPMN_191779 [Dreissena polymorpha]